MLPAVTVAAGTAIRTHRGGRCIDHHGVGCGARQLRYRAEVAAARAHKPISRTLAAHIGGADHDRSFARFLPPFHGAPVIAGEPLGDDRRSSSGRLRLHLGALRYLAYGRKTRGSRAMGIDATTGRASPSSVDSIQIVTASERKLQSG